MTNRMRFSLGLAMAASLLGCSKAETPAAEAANNNEITAAAPAAPAAAPAATPAAAPADLGPDFMVGKWSAMNEDCSDTLEFRKDGTVNTPFGEGKWTLAGDQLSVDFGEGSKMDPSTIKALSPDRIEISKKSGGKETQKRC